MLGPARSLRLCGTDSFGGLVGVSSNRVCRKMVSIRQMWQGGGRCLASSAWHREPDLVSCMPCHLREHSAAWSATPQPCDVETASTCQPLCLGQQHKPNGLSSQVCFITNPVWVVKTRLQLQRRRHLSAVQVAAAAGQSPAAAPYKGFVHAVTQIARHEGLAGFYRGLGPSLIMVSPLAAARKAPGPPAACHCPQWLLKAQHHLQPCRACASLSLRLTMRHVQALAQAFQDACSLLGCCDAQVKHERRFIPCM